MPNFQNAGHGPRNVNIFKDCASRSNPDAPKVNSTPKGQATKQTRFDVIFNAILAKNQIARSGKVTVERLLDIEEALAIAAKMLGRRDNQPSVQDCMNQTVI